MFQKKSILKEITNGALFFTVLIALIGLSYTGYNITLAADDNYPDQTKASDDYVTVLKSANWTNESKGEAQITIEVQSDKTNVDVVGNMKNADFIFIADTSKSAYDGTKLSKSQIERELILPAARGLLEGDFAHANNRVAFFEFGQAAFFYSSSPNNSRPEVYAYDTLEWNDHAKSFRMEHKKLAKSRSESDYRRYYNLAYDTIADDFSLSYVKFYSDVNQIQNVITNASNNNPEASMADYNMYTNIDVPLITANYLIDNRSSNEKRDRKVYVIFVTDGVPDPIGIAKKSDGSGNYNLSVDGMATDPGQRQGLESVSYYTSGKNKGKAKYRNSGWLLDSRYTTNMLYKYAAKQIRNGGNEIFLIKTGTDSKYIGTPYPIWNNITEGIDIPGASDPNYDLTGNFGDLPRNINNYRASYPKLFRENTAHIYTVSNATNVSAGRKAVNNAIEKIKNEIRGDVTTVATIPQLNCTVTDIINYDIFEFNGNASAAVSVNTGTATITGNTVTWTFNDLKYGEKVNGQWPTMTIKLKVKNNDSVETWSNWLNTNYNKPNDDNLVVKHNEPGKPEETITTKTPWLYRTLPGNVYVNFLLKDKKGNIKELVPNKSRYEILNTPIGSNKKLDYTSIEEITVADNFAYLGYEVLDGNVPIKNIKSVGNLEASSTATYSLTPTKRDATINFVFEEQFATIEVVHILVGNNAFFYIDPQLESYEECQYKVAKQVTEKNDDPALTYIGYDVLEGQFSRPLMTKYDLSYQFNNSATASVTPMVGNKNYLVVFAYREPPVDVEIIHWDDTRDREFFVPFAPYNLSKRITFAGLYEFYASIDPNLSVNCTKFYEEIYDAGRDNKVNMSKFFTLINTYAENSRSDIIRSVSRAYNGKNGNPLTKQYFFKNDDKINIDIYANENEADKGLIKFVESEKQRYKMIFDAESVNDGIISKLEDKSKITFKLHYNVHNIVTVKHYYVDDNLVIQNEIGETSYFTGEAGGTARTDEENEELVYEPVDTITFNDKNYNYCGEYDSEPASYKVNNNITINQTKPSIEVRNLYDDITIKLYYKGPRQLTVRHLDKDDDYELYDDNTIFVDYNGNTTVSAYGTINTKLRDTRKHQSVNDKFYYKFTGEYTADIGNATAEPASGSVNQDVSIENLTQEFNSINLYYQKYWPIKIHYVDKATQLEIIDAEIGEVMHNKSSKVSPKKIDEYKYIGEYKINDGNIQLGDFAEVTATGPLEITFYYLRQPTISGDYVPEQPIEQVGDPDDPTNPLNNLERDNKVIVLDELFTINYKIDNYNYADKNYNVTIEFPFDTYMISTGETTYENGIKGQKKENDGNGLFVEAGERILVDVIEPNATEETKEGKYTFRLPSWIKEGEFTNSVLKITAQDDQTDVISECELTVYVVGRVYDFKVTNVVSDEHWHRNLFEEQNYLREYRADTLPIGQSIVNPNLSKLDYKNVNNNVQNSTWRYGMILGSRFLFDVKTKGLWSEKINIVPKLVFVDKTGRVVSNNEVKFTYKVNGIGEVDFTDSNGVIKAQYTGNTITASLNDSDRYNNSKEIAQEMKKAGTLSLAGENLALREKTNNSANFERYKYANFVNDYRNAFNTGRIDIGGYGKVSIPKVLRLPYVNYASSLLKFAEVHRIGRTYDYNNDGALNHVTSGMQSRILNKNILSYLSNSSGFTKYDDAVQANQDYVAKYIGNNKLLENDNLLFNSLGHWYGEYRLPSTLTVRSRTTNEEVKDGYIIVKFKITTSANINSNEVTYLTYMKNISNLGLTTSEEDDKYTQWQLENDAITETKNNNKKQHSVNVNLPITQFSNSRQVNLDISDGYYPVAIYNAGYSLNDLYEVAGTH